MGRLTTHVLDTTAGRPAGLLRVKLYCWAAAEDRWAQIGEWLTNADGRVDTPLLEGLTMIIGNYQLAFYVGDYFARQGSPDAKQFLDVVPIEFSIGDTAAHYHVPLLCSPWAYSTYRGS